MNSKKPLILSIILVVVIAAAGVGGFLLWQSNQQLTDTNSQQSDDITSLRRQLAAAQATPTPTPTPTPAPLAAFTFKEFGVQFTPTTDLANLTATYSTTTKSFGLNSKTLAAKGSDCTIAGALGNLSRQAKGSLVNQSSNATKVATVGSYDYYYGAPGVGCSQVAGAGDIQTAQSTALKAALAALK